MDAALQRGHHNITMWTLLHSNVQFYNKRYVQWGQDDVQLKIQGDKNLKSGHQYNIMWVSEHCNVQFFNSKLEH